MREKSSKGEKSKAIDKYRKRGRRGNARERREAKVWLKK